MSNEVQLDHKALRQAALAWFNASRKTFNLDPLPSPDRIDEMALMYMRAAITAYFATISMKE